MAVKYLYNLLTQYLSSIYRIDVVHLIHNIQQNVLYCLFFFMSFCWSFSYLIAQKTINYDKFRKKYITGGCGVTDITIMKKNISVLESIDIKTIKAEDIEKYFADLAIAYIQYCQVTTIKKYGKRCQGHKIIC